MERRLQEGLISLLRLFRTRKDSTAKRYAAETAHDILYLLIKLNTWESEILVCESGTDEAQSQLNAYCLLGWEPVGISTTATTIRILIKRRNNPDAL